MRKSFLANFFILLGSIIVSLVLLEASLRLAGRVYNTIRSSGDAQVVGGSARKGNAFTIICLGDSYTYGLGTSFEYSYPRQLASALKVGNHSKTINVYNLGSPGGNSCRILKIFKENIAKYNPDLAIIMVGTNNEWNLEGMQDQISGDSSLGFHNLRIYKLFKIIMLSLKNKLVTMIPGLGRRESFPGQHKP